MPSRAEFLAGLTAPIEVAEDDSDCSICYFPLTDPVIFHCNHVFDRECIKTWLVGHGSNTCPKCREVLFDLPLQATLTANPQSPRQSQIAEPGTPAHRALLRRALRLSGLQEDRSGAPTTLQTMKYGPFTESEIYDASVSVAQFLTRGGGQTEQGEFFLNTEEGGREVVHGLALLDVSEALLARMVAFIYLIPAISASAGRPYGEQKLRDWHVLMNELYDELSAKDGQMCDVNLLAHQLRASIAHSFEGYRYDLQSPFLASHEDMGGLCLEKLDFDLVLEFVCWSCWKEQEARQG